MKILLLAHGFNSLTQRLWVELGRLGHDVSLELDVNDATTIQAVELARPDLVLAPFLKRAIPEEVWSNRPCWVVHPGPQGDRGPSALDWAILTGAESWGVTVLQAVAEMDAGPVLAHRTFPMRAASKSSLYRNEVTEAAVDAVLEALDKFDQPLPPAPTETVWRPAMKQSDRAIDWNADDTATILRKIRSADGTPGLLDSIHGQAVHLHDARAAPGLTGSPGALIARSGEAVARATVDGAIWIGHLRAKAPLALKLPAARVIDVQDLPDQPGYHDIWYDERHGVGYLYFPFLNGAMDTGQCKRLQAAFEQAATRPTRVIVLAGGPDYWSNGIHLGAIEAAASPAEESWANINAMNDLCHAILGCRSHVTFAAMEGSAGAGGVFMALACDHVLARHGVILNPHYKGMGNLYGSEYWTYTLPRRCGAERAQAVTEARLPMGVEEAKELGLIDDWLDGPANHFRAQIAEIAERLPPADKPDLGDLEAFRTNELEHMKLNFFGFDPSYHVARYNFIHKVPKSRTPLYLARHRGK